ncbi:MAG: transporter, partial [Candidatus Aminicenantes bacterium]|nr:transporter [Candidatus Aminicenantes bacterium]
MNARGVSRATLAAAAAGAILTMALAASPAEGGTLSYTGSLQMARGTYIFTQPTSGYFFFNGLRFSSSSFSLAATIPVIYQNTPYVSYTGLGVLPSGGTESSSVNQRQGREPVLVPEIVEYNQYGIGDPVITAGLTLVKEGRSLPAVQISGTIKAPLASVERGFGTGEWDYSAGLGLSKRLGQVFLFADVSYWILGDLPELELKNASSYAFSFGHAFSGGKLALMASYSGITEVIAGVAPPSSLGLGFSVRAGAASSLMLNAAVGLSEASPDLSL